MFAIYSIARCAFRSAICRAHARKRTSTIASAALVGLLILVAGSPIIGQDAHSLAPYVPTPNDVVDRMLALAEVTKNDVLYDLGCGDGRIVIAAAQKYGARAVGVDIDPQRILESQVNAKRAGVENLTTFLLKDATTVDLSNATVVTLYLLSSSNLKLRPILTKQLKPGARIVSHQFSMGDWDADKVESYKDSQGVIRTLFLWKADGAVRP